MIIDIIVLVILLASCVISLVRGFIRETLTILGVGGGLAASYLGGPFLAPFMAGWFGVDPNSREPVQKLFDIVPYSLVADLVSYGGIFVAVVIALSLTSHIIAEAAKTIGLGAVDRTLGVVFGLVRGVLLLGLLYLPVYLLVDDATKEQWMADSRTKVYLDLTAAQLAGFLPKESTEQISQDRQTLFGESTREKLQSLDLLKDQNAVEQINKVLKENADGYTDEFRDEMNDLFKQEALDANPLNQSQGAGNE